MGIIIYELILILFATMFKLTNLFTVFNPSELLARNYVTSINTCLAIVFPPTHKVEEEEH